jgi:serpin B
MMIFVLLACACAGYADMGGIHAYDAAINEDSQKAVILHNLKQEVLILGADMRSDTTTAVLRFIPFPSEPKVSLAPPDALESAAKLIKRHRLKFYYQTKGVSPSSSGVELKFSEKLGEHDLTVVKVNDINYFREWVNRFFKEKGLPTKEKYPDVEAVAADYLKRGINYFVFDLVNLTPETHFVDPLMFLFESKMLYYPLKTSNTLSGKREIDLILITPGTLEKSGFSPGNFIFSSLATISMYEIENIFPDCENFFGEQNIYLQLMRHRGEYDFQDDILFDPSKGVPSKQFAEELSRESNEIEPSFSDRFDKYAAQPGMPELISGLAQANSRFAFEMYKKAAAGSETKGKNIFFSPYSISTALAMACEGARNKTKEQMEITLYFYLLNHQLRVISSALSNEVKKSCQKGCRLFIANAIWGQQGYPLNEDFTDTIDKYYDGAINQVDFSGHTEQSRKTINGWVEKNTSGMIKELLSADDVDPATTLILTNAIYFKSSWDVQFKKEDTRKAPFYITPEHKIEARMMRRSGDFSYGQADGKATLLEMPYKGKELSMVVLLPGGDIRRLEKGLTYTNVNKWLSHMRTGKNMEVLLPKFKFSSRYYLQPLLQDMGIADAFSAKADFSGISKDGNLSISKVIHQANIDVNEEGTEAPAATAVEMGKSMPVQFRADRPFIFLILHKPTNFILFMGRVMNPAEGE